MQYQHEPGEHTFRKVLYQLVEKKIALKWAWVWGGLWVSLRERIPIFSELSETKLNKFSTNIINSLPKISVSSDGNRLLTFA